ncbi:hypothetical protein AHAS_Ahas10G0102800 [Arachis hypogaea]|uniref:Myb/SANT-like domain-containing protein n=1 Tax=Arachis hypogaea TaxID=3818 RepID=A0A445B8I3_ARAHY|nr:hypothetical protein Ahy_A10g050044 [Arachis hypogaea]
MLACSRFGWNNEKQCVEVDSKDVLDTWLKAHPTKFYSSGKPFSLFHRLEGIVGKDKATGAGAVNGFDEEEHISPNPDIDGGQAVQGQASHSKASASGGSTRQYGKKRKQADVLEGMADHIQKSSVDQRKNAQLLADVIVGVNEKFKVGKKACRLFATGGDDKNINLGLWLLVDH